MAKTFHAGDTKPIQAARYLALQLSLKPNTAPHMRISLRQGLATYWNSIDRHGRLARARGRWLTSVD